MTSICTGAPAPIQQGVTKRRRRRPAIPKSTFTAYIDEGLMHLKKMAYRKAKYCFDRALEMDKEDPLALISRSKCNMNLGLHEEALRDAEACFELNQKFVPGLHHFGEILFTLGFFEKALIYYHQGRRVRKNFEGFYKGILKSEHAIQTAILDRDGTRIEDLDDILPLIEEIEQEDSLKVHQCCVRVISAETLLENRVPLLPPKNKEREKWVTREILGTLASHKFFVERVLRRLSDPRYQLDSAVRIQENVTETLFFLEHHERLLRYMKPMYFRKKGLNKNQAMVNQFEQEVFERQQSNQKVVKDAAESAVLRNILQIEHALSMGRHRDAQLEAERSIRQMRKINDKQIPRKHEFILDMIHYQGIALSRQKLYTQAINVFKRELKIGQKQGNEAIISRSLDLMARAHALNGDFNDAIEVWETRLEFAKTPLERAYTNHEIGRGNLEAGKRELARYYANECLSISMESNITIWATFARVLLGQVEIKNGNFLDAQNHFRNGLEVLRQAGQSQSMCKMLEEMVQCLRIIVQKNQNQIQGSFDDESDQQSAAVPATSLEDFDDD
ncbi:unnamed protein product [Allacma fusca]|uniref:Tetratricopeptide repeat protein 25 n=1 Tax=Allacma fusca TaxID=39272 RepID=A0A8J2NN02_9HEXA|nr:unnamed protein product [Allacma fusca]